MTPATDVVTRLTVDTRKLDENRRLGVERQGTEYGCRSHLVASEPRDAPRQETRHDEHREPDCDRQERRRGCEELHCEIGRQDGTNGDTQAGHERQSKGGTAQLQLDAGRRPFVTGR